MKRALALLVAVMVVATGAAAAATIDDTAYSAFDDEGTEIEDGVVADNGTLDILTNVDSVEVEKTVNFSDADSPSNETITFKGDAGLVGTFEGVSTSENDTVMQTKDLQVENGTATASFTMELQNLSTDDEFTDGLMMTVDYDDNGTNETMSQSFNVTTTTASGGSNTGTIIGGVPDFFKNMGDFGVFLFFAISVGAIILGGLVIYFLHNKTTVGKKQEAASYAVISAGGLGAMLTEYAWVIVAVFVLLAGTAVYLWKFSGEAATIDEGTTYIE